MQMVSETKIDDTFPESQFLIEGFSKPGNLLYIREDIACRYTKQITLNNSLEGLFVEINVRIKKWIPRCSYNHHKEK